MSSKNGVGIKLIFAFILVAILSVSLQVVLLSRAVSTVTTAEALAFLSTLNADYANQSSAFFANGLELAKNLNTVVTGLQKIAKERNITVDRDMSISLLASLHDNNPWASALWVVWEPNAFDGQDAAYANKPYHDKTGRLVATSFTSGGKNALYPLEGYDQEGLGDYYLIPFKTQANEVLEPYQYVYPDGQKSFLTTMSVPVIENGKTVGVGGTDVELEFFKTQFAAVQPMDAGRMMLLSPGLQIVGHSNPDLVGQLLQDTPYAIFTEKLKASLASGQPSAEIFPGGWVLGQEDAALAIVPFKPGGVSQNWLVATIVPMSRIMRTNDILMQSSLTSGLMSLVLTIIIGLLAVKIVVGGLTRHIIHIVNDLDEIASHVTVDVNQLSMTTDEISGGTISSAAALDQISISLNEITNKTKETLDTSEKTNTKATKTLAIVAQAVTNMSSMMAAMNDTNDSAAKIHHIIKTTEEVAFQINLLALNASVEAARAGEAGAGFAVVADEVRNLATKSADSAESTRALIDVTTSCIKRGFEASTLLEDGIRQMEIQTKAIVGLISEINEAAVQQDLSTSQVNEALGVLNTTVNSNANSVSELAEAAKLLSQESQKMGPIFDSLKKL